ncbi:Mor transcription activator family protein [Variovorax sp. GB1P17]|uniref:Mor transcription activator family protein n=1 Tax=Variovorax sp. GB1P17 TaxID=3443740 RepID=UPI003F454CEC
MQEAIAHHPGQWKDANGGGRMSTPEFVGAAPFSSRGIAPSPPLPPPHRGNGLRQAATALALELLPPRLREFVRLIGLPATLRLIERYGGLRIYIPAHPAPDHPFAGLIGFDKLRALSAEYAIDGTGLRFVLPKAQRAFDAIRNEQIRTDFSCGKSVRALAAEHHLVERQVARIVADIAF